MIMIYLYSCASHLLAWYLLTDELMGRVALHEKPVPVSLQRARVVLGGQAAVAPSREGSLAKRLHSTSKEQMASKLFIQDTAGKRYLLVSGFSPQISS